MGKIKKFDLIKLLIFIGLFCAAIYFENAGRERFIFLIAIFAFFIINQTVKSYINEDSKLYVLSFLADIIFIYIFEFNSRLLINYFFHTFYIIIILEATLTLPQKKGLIIGTAAVLISMIKYIFLLYYKFSFSNATQMAFFLVVNLLIMVIASFAQFNKKEKEKQDILYKELLNAHKQLKEYTEELNRLSVVEERNRIARDIHDTLGHNMTALIMQLQMAEHFLKDDANKAGELLDNSLKTARDSLIAIREVVETLRGRESIIEPIDSIKKLIKDFSEKTSVEIDYIINGEVLNHNNGIYKSLFHIFQEAMTNAVRHGNASKIWIELNFTDNSINFYVRDNGEGAIVINEGFGMKGIRERVKSYNGSVEFGSNDGFFIKGVLYLEEKHD